MPTLADLGKLVKQKYPQYRHMSDEEVGRAVKRKYPDKYKQYTDTALVRRGSFEIDFDDFKEHLINESGIRDIGRNYDLLAKYEEVFDFYNPKQGLISDYFQEKRTEKELKIVSNLSATQQKLLEAISRQAEAVQLQRKTAAEFYFFLQENFGKLQALQSEIARAEDAWEKYEMSPKDVSTVNVQKHLTSLRIEEKKQDAKIRVKEYKKKSDIDLNQTLREKQEAVRLSLISKHLSEIQKIALLQDQIDEIYHQINEIEHDRITSANGLKLVQWIKDEMIKDRKEIIAGLKETRRAIDGRLRETHTRAVLGGMDVDTDLR